MSTDTLPRRKSSERLPSFASGGVLITAAIIHYYAGTLPLPDRDVSHWLAMRNRLWE